jgi:alpha-galactosidase
MRQPAASGDDARKACAMACKRHRNHRKSAVPDTLMKKTISLLALSMMCCAARAQKFDELALTPPMGWNSWNKFAGNVSEDLIRQTADAMVSSGMKDAGYQYINIDDCWHGERDSQGFIQADPKRFPSGIKALADYVHARGLKLGIYSDAGFKTCAGKPGSRGHEYQDAMRYAQWGVDYLKYDWCYVEGLKAEGAYLTMREALHAAGRPMVFSICEWGTDHPWIWGPRMGHLWRTTGDIVCCFDCVKVHDTWRAWGVLQILDMQEGLRKYAGPGHWNDPDMLEVGNGMAANEDRAHFSMWCMLAAPLIAGNDIANMSKATSEILLNKEVIAVDQDPLGVEGFKFSAKDKVDVWFKPLSDGAWAMCVLNRNTEPRSFTFAWKKHKMSDELSNRDAGFAKTTYTLRNLWTHEDAGTTQETLKAVVPGHDVLMFRLSKK